MGPAGGRLSELSPTTAAAETLSIIRPCDLIAERQRQSGATQIIAAPNKATTSLVCAARGRGTLFREGI
jgi:hypothetical protein